MLDLLTAAGLEGKPTLEKCQALKKAKIEKKEQEKQAKKEAKVKHKEVVCEYITCVSIFVEYIYLVNKLVRL